MYNVNPSQYLGLEVTELTEEDMNEIIWGDVDKENDLVESV